VEKKIEGKLWISLIVSQCKELYIHIVYSTVLRNQLIAW